MGEQITLTCTEVLKERSSDPDGDDRLVYRSTLTTFLDQASHDGAGATQVRVQVEATDGAAFQAGRRYRLRLEPVDEPQSA